ncbi:hypothetical protein FHU38_001949 [Saccharomonospora amisosensis]|uniref:Uncharacterized protein n=1 Tax=Saccharomonospora amisosensis TaxID=1128677 RepID=A0A7X5ZQU2_9PSEU|nr:hypothetical protein [Saccharomonospora amisosensis]NIJ11605.1 hypothetical protein [Saccharomonospora amisosensis]
MTPGQWADEQMRRIENRARASLNLPPLPPLHPDKTSPNTAGQPGGHDTTANDTPCEPDTSSMVGGTATVGVRAAGDVSRATVVMTNGHTTVTGGTGTAGQAEEVMRRARENARQARARARQARQQARTEAETTLESGSHASTVHHPGGSITNVTAGTVGIQAARQHGNTVHTD